MENLTNQTIGGYNLVELIGKGGMAAVYKAYQPKLERWVAVKVLNEAYTAEESEMLARFRREAKAIATLRHPNILTIYDYGEEAGLAYIVMEHVDGGTLKDRLAGTPFDWQKAIRLATAMGKALEFAHSRGIVHRDVKPANILMPSTDWPLLSDFGLVKLQQDRRAITTPGTTMGTPAYNAPEQAVGDPSDHRVDIYALGVVLFEMIAWRKPFETNNPVEMLMMHLKQPPPSPCGLVPDLPKEVERVVLRALAKSPDERYCQMTDMVSELEAAQRAAMATPRFPDSPSETMQITLGQMPTGTPCLTIMGTGAVLQLPPKEEVLIGRADPKRNIVPDIDLSAYGGGPFGVSRQHARLLRRADGWFIEDLNSTYGTFVNAQPVSPGQPTPLKDGDTVSFSQMMMIFNTS